MLWILAKLEERYPDDLWRRQNTVAARTKTRFIKAGTPGQADILGCHKGLYVELEVKRPGEVQSEKQREHEQKVKRAGGVYAVVENPTEAFDVVDAL
jgi:hypothetical protein